MWILALIPNWAKLGAAVVVGGLLMAAPAYFYGRHSEAAEMQLAAAKAALDRIQKMEKRNANFKNLPAHDRCVAFMRDSGLPTTECD